MTAHTGVERPNVFVVKHFQRLAAAVSLAHDVDALRILAHALMDEMGPLLAERLSHDGLALARCRAGSRFSTLPREQGEKADDDQRASALQRRQTSPLPARRA